ncbi:MAG: hypothetical protein PVSMB5_03070 [Ktedonobacteraceae bacterium]
MIVATLSLPLWMKRNWNKNVGLQVKGRICPCKELPQRLSQASIAAILEHMDIRAQRLLIGTDNTQSID